MRKNKITLLLTFLFASFQLFAQDVTINGNITDIEGDPLPGVNIVIKGTTTGAITDLDGNYSLNVPDQDAVLVYSFIGFASIEEPVGGRTTINVVLSEEITQLGEIMVVGYGTQVKRDVTGAISSVKSEDIENLPIASSSQALQGRMSGVQVVRTGAPGENGKIRIRGTGTINNADPLIIIDGFPGGSLDDVSPNDIESIEVLKDASSSAIYGTRAANGVIIITTKRGKTNEKMQFSVNAYTGISNVVSTVDVLEAPQLAELKRERYTNDGDPINPIWQDPAYQTQKTNWQDELFGTGKKHNLDITLRGGGAKSSYNMMLGYFDEQGMIKNSYFKRLSFRVNSDHKVSDRFTIKQSLQLATRRGNSIETNSAQTGVIWSAIRFHPGLPVMDADGNYGSSQVSGEFGDINNPIFTVDTDDREYTRHSLLGTLYFEYEILDGLKAQANFGIDGYINNNRSFDIIIDEQIRARSRNGLSRDFGEGYSALSELFLSYNKVLADKHRLNAVAGYTAQTFNYDYFSAHRSDFADESELKRYLDGGNTIDGASGTTTYDALQSIFGRVNYDFDGRYLLNVTFRRDGSSRFAEGNKWGNFPAFSAGWRVSEEDFWNSGFINNLKILGGWGQLGNQNVSRYQYLATISGGRRYSFGDNQTVGSWQSSIPNPDITWETVEMSNFGAEMTMLNDALLLDVNYFIKNTKDMLLPVPVIGSMGSASVPDRNFGEMQNKGLEFELSYRGQTGDFYYNIGGIASLITNEVVKLNAPFLQTRTYGRPNQEINRIFPNEPLGVFYGWVADGLYQNTAEINSDPNIANDTRLADGLIEPGDVKFVDQTGDGIIDEDDRTIIGDPNASIIYGINASMQYKGFDFVLFFNGEAGREIFNADRMQGLDPTYPFNMYAEVMDRWTGDGTSNSIPRMTTRRNNLNHRASTLFVEKAGYLRLRNITLGYTIPSSLINNWGISKVRIYISGENLFTITPYTGLDPELGYTDGNLQYGVDYAGYPQARTITAGLTVGF